MTELAQFLWGAPEKVRSLLRPDIPQFRLVNAAPGDLPPVAQSFTAVNARNVRPLRDDSGRVLGTLWEDDDADYCLLAGVMPADISAPRGVQASNVFRRLEHFLAQAGMAFSDVVRTWLYIDRVCEWYGEFNAARSEFFEERNVFNTFLPASTGIGSANLDGAALIAGAYAMRPKGDGARAEIVESPLQAPAMAYKSSFSRAAEVFRASGRRLFVSGTASIKPNSHDVAYVGDIARQIDCTMNAVKAILESRGYGWGDVPRAIVYLKEPSFRDAWRAWLAAQGLPMDFAAETVCDVCRDEWLFEIECDTVRGAL
jgi:enamine deaminase RidA (YjgF/YER057c/UK114 family)